MTFCELSLLQLTMQSRGATVIRLLKTCPIRPVGLRRNPAMNSCCTEVRELWTSRVTAAADKKLFTPGPLGTSLTVRKAMLRDLGSRDTEFINTIQYIRENVLKIAGVGKDKYTTVPLQGSGTYAVEAVLQTATPKNGGKVLILANGAYGKRMDRICEVANIPRHMLLFPEDKPVDLQKVEQHLTEQADYALVAIVHCETSSGVMNPIQPVSHLIKKYASHAAYFIDAMSSFGAIPFKMEEVKADYVVSSANKCLQGVPGFSFAVARLDHLMKCKGNCRTLSLDLVDQYLNLENTGQFRFTPATHAMLAFKQALDEFFAEGGVEGRQKRYQENNRIVKEGMKKMGFKELVDPKFSGPIITSFLFPNDKNFNFGTFYAQLNDLDQVIYPGKVTDAECFRIGNIGDLHPQDMLYLLTCIQKVCEAMRIVLPVN